MLGVCSARWAFPALPIGFAVVFVVLPLALTIAVSFWTRVGLVVRPAFTFTSYEAFFAGARLLVLERSFLASIEATVLGLLLAYPIAYFLAFKVSPRAARTVLLLFTVPFLVNYIIRAFAWTWLLGRTGLINTLLMASGLTNEPLDWLLYSDVAVLIGLVTSYMPFMIFPLWLSLAGIDRRLIQASWMLGAPPARTFLRVTLPLSSARSVRGSDLRVRRLLRRKRHSGHHGRCRVPDDGQQHRQRHGRAELSARRRDIDRRAGWR